MNPVLTKPSPQRCCLDLIVHQNRIQLLHLSRRDSLCHGFSIFLAHSISVDKQLGHRRGNHTNLREISTWNAYIQLKSTYQQRVFQQIQEAVFELGTNGVSIEKTGIEHSLTWARASCQDLVSGTSRVKMLVGLTLCSNKRTYLVYPLRLMTINE